MNILISGMPMESHKKRGFCGKPVCACSTRAMPQRGHDREEYMSESLFSVRNYLLRFR